MTIQCLLVCEGSSDAGLVPHIRLLLDGCGYPDASFNVTTDGRRLDDKIRSGLALASHYDLLFVHRDADRAGADAPLPGNRRRSPPIGIRRPHG